MVRLIVRLAILAVALWVAELLVNFLIPNGMLLTNVFPDLLFVTIIFAVVNLLVKPVTSFLTSQFVDAEWLRFNGPWDGFWAAMLAGVIISIVSTVLSSLAND